jgi:hypothetical protein
MYTSALRFQPLGGELLVEFQSSEATGSLYINKLLHQHDMNIGYYRLPSG